MVVWPFFFSLSFPSPSPGPCPRPSRRRHSQWHTQTSCHRDGLVRGYCQWLCQCQAGGTTAARQDHWQSVQRLGSWTHPCFSGAVASACSGCSRLAPPPPPPWLRWRHPLACANLCILLSRSLCHWQFNMLNPRSSQVPAAQQPVANTSARKQKGCQRPVVENQKWTTGTEPSSGTWG
jgi:hypothetical protein